MSAYTSYQTQLAEQAVSDKRIAEQKIKDEENRIILEEKAKTPVPKITITSDTKNQ
jgi:hypothetical protein